MSDFIRDLKKSVHTSDLNQAKLLLADISRNSEQEKLEILHILALASDQIALTLLDFILEQPINEPDMSERLIQLVIDRAHLNFEFVLTFYRIADKDKLIQAIPLIRHILTNETRPDILTVSIETIGKHKIDPLVDDVAEFIYYDDPLLKSKAVRALERLGNPAALHRLEQAAATEKCDQDILDAVEFLKKEGEQVISDAGLKTPESVDPEPENYEDLIGQLTSMNLDERFKAFTDLLETGEQSFNALKHCLASGDHDLVLNALRIFSRTLPYKATSRIFPLLEGKGQASGIRFMAFEALGNFPELESAASLVKGISEFDPAVRMAAVRALDKNLTDFVCAEIREKIESGTKAATGLAQTILDAGAVHIMDYLLVSDTFSYMASNYLTKDTPAHVLEAYVTLLEKRKLKSTVKKYQAFIQEQAERQMPGIAVVSTEKTVLKIYARIISSLGCRPLLFTSPQEAFESVLQNKPQLLITDLFLNDMTGVTFAAEIREMYTQEDLTILISSLQKDLVKAMDKTPEYFELIDGIYGFPIQPSQLKSFVRG